MFNKLLGRVVWKGAKLYFGRRLGPRVGAKALAVGGVLALGIGAAAMLAKRGAGS
jgi:hypothetical protein